MNYIKAYRNLICRAGARSISGYYEVHHIVPRCLGGTDDPSNLVRLTAPEHFICHLLLAKAYPNEPALLTAAMLMSGKSKYTSKAYGKLKAAYSNYRSQVMSGPLNPTYGKARPKHVKDAVSAANTGAVRPPEHRAAISKAQTGKVLSRSTKDKISKANLGKTVSQETRNKSSAAQLGKPRSADSAKKRSKTVTGVGNHRYGKGDEVRGSLNPMFGRKWYVNINGEKIAALEGDERLMNGIWQRGTIWK